MLGDEHGIRLEVRLLTFAVWFECTHKAVSQSVSSRSPALTTQTSQRTTAPLREYSRSPRSNTMYYCDPTRNSLARATQFR
jgi:hypothetical protein